jgi:chemotaxis signal transduction protein
VTTSLDGAAVPERRGGIILRVDGQLRFLFVADAVRISSPPRVTPVPGAPGPLLGITLYEGTIVPVLSIGSARREMIVCQHAGEVLGLLGGEIVQTGTFDAADDGVKLGGTHAPALDLSAIYARVLTGPRAARPPLR